MSIDAIAMDIDAIALDVGEDENNEESQYALRAILEEDILKSFRFNHISVIGEIWTLLKHQDQQVSLAALKVLMRTSCNYPCVLRSIINCNEYSIDISLLSNVLNLCFPLGDRDMLPSDIPSDERSDIQICLSFLQCLLEIRPHTISLLPDPLVFYRKCFRYLCHADFFLRVLNILKVVFDHVEESNEAQQRVQKGVNEFFSQKTQAFEETGLSQAELSQIMAIFSETARSLQFELKLSDDLACTDFFEQKLGETALPADIPPIWQVYWNHDRMLHVLLNSLKNPPQDDSSYHRIALNLSEHFQHNWLRSFVQKFLGRRINLHSMISVTNDEFLVFSSDVAKEMDVDGQTNEIFSTHEDKGMDVNGPTIELFSTNDEEMDVDVPTRFDYPLDNGQVVSNVKQAIISNATGPTIDAVETFIDAVSNVKKKKSQLLDELISINEVQVDETSLDELIPDTFLRRETSSFTYCGEIECAATDRREELWELKEKRTVSKLIKSSVSRLINKFEHANIITS